MNFVFGMQFVVLPINLFLVEFSNIHYFSNLVPTTNLNNETKKEYVKQLNIKILPS